MGYELHRHPVHSNYDHLCSKEDQPAAHAVSNTCRVATGHSLSPLLGPALLLKALTSLLVLPNVSFMLTSKQLIVPRHASLTISTTTKPKDCRSSFAACMQT